jgi:hypothetical protein
MAARSSLNIPTPTLRGTAAAEAQRLLVTTTRNLAPELASTAVLAAEGAQPPTIAVVPPTGDSSQGGAGDTGKDSEEEDMEDWLDSVL